MPKYNEKPELRMWAARAFLIPFLISLFTASGTLTGDALLRYQLTKSLWTSEPEVVIAISPIFNQLPGRNGVLRASYGLGQSLIMLPGDMLGALISLFGNSESTKSKLRLAITQLATFPFVNGLASLSAFWLLISLEYSGAMAFLIAICTFASTSLLPYLFSDFENTLQFLLFTSFAACMTNWIKSPTSIQFLRYGAAASGFGILVRPTMVAALLGGFLIWGQQLKRLKSVTRLESLRCFARYFLPIFSAFVLLERAIHFYRFDEWFGTYMGHIVKAYKVAGGMPHGYPLNFPLAKGIAYTVLHPNKSLFLFDPILFLSIFAFVQFRSTSIARRLMLAGFGALFLNILIYCQTYYWDGWPLNWGTRHQLPFVDFICLCTLAFCCMERLSPPQILVMKLCVGLGIAIQCSSLLLSPAIEMAQQAAIGIPIPLPFLRLFNVVLWVTSQILDLAQIHLISPQSITEPSWRFPSPLVFHSRPFFEHQRSYSNLVFAWILALVVTVISFGRWIREALAARVIESHDTRLE